MRWLTIAKNRTRVNSGTSTQSVLVSFGYLLIFLPHVRSSLTDRDPSSEPSLVSGGFEDGGVAFVGGDDAVKGHKKRGLERRDPQSPHGQTLLPNAGDNTDQYGRCPENSLTVGVERRGSALRRGRGGA
jgi:hypothetical protein